MVRIILFARLSRQSGILSRYSRCPRAIRRAGRGELLKILWCCSWGAITRAHLVSRETRPRQATIRPTANIATIPARPADSAWGIYPTHVNVVQIPNAESQHGGDKAMCYHIIEKHTSMRSGPALKRCFRSRKTAETTAHRGATGDRAGYHLGSVPSIGVKARHPF